jgi:hypothetical protein
MSKPKFPFGPADVQTRTHAATIAATITDAKTFLQLAQMTGNATVNLTVDPQLEAGAELIVRASADGTNRTLTPGTGLTGVAQTITANKSVCIRYVYNGTTFLHCGTTQLD